MPKVMIRSDAAGRLSLYVPKRDLEESIVAIQHDTSECWGGEISLADGSRFLLDVLDTRPSLPITLRARRVGGEH